MDRSEIPALAAAAGEDGLIKAFAKTVQLTAPGEGEGEDSAGPGLAKTILFDDSLQPPPARPVALSPPPSVIAEGALAEVAGRAAALGVIVRRICVIEG
jgi:hypothetical protein